MGVGAVHGVTTKPPFPVRLRDRRHTLAHGILNTACRRPARLTHPGAAVHSDGFIRSHLATTLRGYSTAAPPRHVAIIGAGVTGLTTAYYLARRLPATSTITIYEHEQRVGGWIKTKKRRPDDDGSFVLLESGPKTLRALGKSAWRADDFVFWSLADDLSLPVVLHERRRKYIYYSNRLVPVPPTIPQLFTEPLFNDALGTLTSVYNTRRRILRGTPAGPPPDVDISLGDWIRSVRPNGHGGLLDNMLSAMMHGIYGGNIDELSLPSVLPSFWHNLHALRKYNHVLMPRQDYDLMKTLGRDDRVKERVHSSARFESMALPGGMEVLVEALRRSLDRTTNVDFQMSSPVTNVSYDKTTDKVALHINGEPKLHDKAISTIFSRTTGDIAHIHSLLDTHAVSILNIGLWYPTPHLTGKCAGTGYLIPRSVKTDVLGVFFDSDAYGSTTDGETSGSKFSVLMGGHHWQHSPDVAPHDEPDLISTKTQQAISLLQKHLRIPKTTQPGCIEASFARNCIPQHRVGHRKTMAKAHEELQTKFAGRLAVVGGSYTAIGVLPSIRAAFDMAAHVAGETQWHVGDTGLAQFAKHPEILQVAVEEALACGKVPRLENRFTWAVRRLLGL